MTQRFISKLAESYDRGVLRRLDPRQRRNVRIVLIANGLVLFLGGLLAIVLFNGVLPFTGSDGVAALLLWPYWALFALFAAMAACGWLIHRFGRALPRD